MTTVIGIDPGKEGGICIISGPSFSLHVDARVMPMMRGKGRSAYNIDALRELFTGQPIDLVVVELQQAMRGGTKFDGAVASFSSGTGFGILLGMLGMGQIPHEVVNSKTWQAKMLKGVVGPDTKAKAALVAQRLQPRINWKKSDHWACKDPHTGKCDAYCIAEYGRRELAKRAGQVLAPLDFAIGA